MIERFHHTPITHRIVRHAGIVYLGGMVADDKSSGMYEQTRQICAKMDKFLAEAGASKSALLTAQIYVVDMDAKDEMNRAWCEWLTPEELPARLTVGVANLGSKQTLVEIMVSAAVQA